MSNQTANYEGNGGIQYMDPQGFDFSALIKPDEPGYNGVRWNEDPIYCVLRPKIGLDLRRLFG
jgi:hypothetical protein